MASVTCLDMNSDYSDFVTRFADIVQSTHLNFVIGSGASWPAIPLAGCIEKTIDALNCGNEKQQEQAKLKKYEFLRGIQNATVELIDGCNKEGYEQTLSNYHFFLAKVEGILAKRSNHLLPRQANIFTTNYDLLIEKAGENRGYPLVNDGFRRVSSLGTKMQYSTNNFFMSTFHTGNLYNYRAELPSINLLKLHGSLSWRRSGNSIELNDCLSYLEERNSADDLDSLLNTIAVIFPERGKHAETTLTEVYYTLLRTYFNSLEKENSLLIVVGFSFADEHIFDITCRALRNPTLHLIIFAYSDDDKENFKQMFKPFSNVEIVRPKCSNEHIDFAMFNEVLGKLPTVKVSD